MCIESSIAVSITIAYKLFRSYNTRLHGIKSRKLFIGAHLMQIFKENDLDPNSMISESHGLHILRGNGIEVELLEKDGSPLDY